jgi:hypothetical protein
VSPHFLFRVETNKDANNPRAKNVLGDYELASRLSYFLWSSMPDETLFRVAARASCATRTCWPPRRGEC